MGVVELNNKINCNLKIMKNALLALRLAMGWYFAYAGLSKIISPAWSAAGFLKGAQTLNPLYTWFASPANIGWVNFLNEWGLLLVGLALIFGFGVRYASMAGILLMALYYFPTLNFPMAGDHAYIIDDHIVFIIIFWLFISTNAGMYKGLDGRKK